jgi:exosortase/archaeosortase family protein
MPFFASISVCAKKLPLPSPVAWMLMSLTLLYSLPFINSYFIDDPLRYERAILVSIIAFKFLRIVIDGWSGAPEDSRAWYVILLAGVVMSVNQVFIHSLALTNYSFLAWMLGVCWILGGRDQLYTLVRLALAAAIMTYPPRIIFEPFTDGLLQAVIVTSKFLAQGSLPAITFFDQSVMVQERQVAFISACSGSNFMMTYLAVVLIFFKKQNGLSRLALAIISAALLAFSLNVARILAMLTLANHGMWELALGKGHEPIGQGFILVGLLIILNASKVFGAE